MRLIPLAALDRAHLRGVHAGIEVHEYRGIAAAFGEGKRTDTLGCTANVCRICVTPVVIGVNLPAGAVEYGQRNIGGRPCESGRRERRTGVKPARPARFPDHGDI